MDGLTCVRACALGHTELVRWFVCVRQAWRKRLWQQQQRRRRRRRRSWPLDHRSHDDLNSTLETEHRTQEKTWSLVWWDEPFQIHLDIFRFINLNFYKTKNICKIIRIDRDTHRLTIDIYGKTGLMIILVNKNDLKMAFLWLLMVSRKKRKIQIDIEQAKVNHFL